jgi:hypothetical protein
VTETPNLGLEDGEWDLVALSGGPVMRIHGEATCYGFCPFHNPSDHPLSTAPLFWLKSMNLMLRRCTCGKLHPDPDSLAYSQLESPFYDGWHACCSKRCCVPPTSTEVTE